VISETHASAVAADMPIRDIIARMRHDGCGGRAGKVELMTGIEGASSRPGAEDRVACRLGPAPGSRQMAWPCAR
jgi:hypothetical protein